MTAALILLGLCAGIFLIPVLLNWEPGRRKPRAKRPRAKRQPRLDVRALQAEKIRGRADHEHAQWMNGDERGLYGQYPPAEL